MRSRLLCLVAFMLLGGAVSGAITHASACKPPAGPQAQAPGSGGCFPTPQECGSGNFNGVYDGGSTPGRGSVCVGAGGTQLVYLGGNAAATCGDVIVAGQV